MKLTQDGCSRQMGVSSDCESAIARGTRSVLVLRCSEAEHLNGGSKFYPHHQNWLMTVRRCGWRER